MLKHLLCYHCRSTCAAVQPQKGYVEYGDYDARKCLKVAKAEDGKESLDLKCVDGIMDNLAKHAKGFPPSFRSKKEQERAERDVKMLSAMFAPIAAKDDAEVEILLRAGSLNSMGHNLNMDAGGEGVQLLRAITEEGAGSRQGKLQLWRISGRSSRSTKKRA